MPMQLTEPQLIALFVALVAVFLILAAVRFPMEQWAEVDEDETR